MALKFSSEIVNELPARTHKGFKKTSKYDPILDDYISKEVDNLKITVPDIKTSYLVGQLNKRIEKRELTGFFATSVNGIVYIIPTKPED